MLDWLRGRVLSSFLWAHTAGVTSNNWITYTTCGLKYKGFWVFPMQLSPSTFRSCYYIHFSIPIHCRKFPEMLDQHCRSPFYYSQRFKILLCSFFIHCQKFPKMLDRVRGCGNCLGLFGHILQATSNNWITYNKLGDPSIFWSSFFLTNSIFRS